ncbi:MAG: hypothetical protein Q7J35_15875 [Candidatus Methanoperedens sp.]|nr:hypothetical protein [Candidatus Methanoperedens sp.]
MGQDIKKWNDSITFRRKNMIFLSDNNMRKIRKVSFVLMFILFFSFVATTASAYTNLLINGGSETGDFTGWTVVNGGNGWAVQSDSTYVLEGTRSFTSSYNWGILSQTINLTSNSIQNYSTAYLDSSPNLSINDYVIGVSISNRDYYSIKVELRDASQSVIASYNTGDLQTINETTWANVSYNFTGYGSGLRYIYYERRGNDQENWAGNYGATFDNASVYFTEATENMPLSSDSTSALDMLFKIFYSQFHKISRATAN